ncbi:hypothetical protein G6F43_003125 [Rhizopus delemar]|nr:hypothetical protein G6F43_003125 [Rhizopus delemar]
MFPANHTSYIRALYKNILAEGSLFFDDRSRIYIRDRARLTFKEYKSCTDIERIKNKIKEARKKLHRIEQANRGKQKSAYKILLEVYGRRGKVRHSLLYPYLHQFKPEDFKLPEPFVPHVPHTAPPPPLCPPLCALITQHLGKRLEPELPVPAFKPLHPGRKANLLWKHRSMLLDRVQVPLPFETLCELETKAGAAANHPVSLAVLGRGGPRWDEFYYVYERNPNITHLSPHLTAFVPQSRLARNQTVADIRSPYSAPSKPSVLDYLEQDELKDKKGPKLLPFSQRYDERQKRRLYRRLLSEIPCITMFTGNTLWNQGTNYRISKSNWAVKGVTQVLMDVPSAEVIDSILNKNKRKKK